MSWGGVVDISGLIAELGQLEQQLLNASQQIALQRENSKHAAAAGGTTGGAALPRPQILPCEGYRIEDGSENPLSPARPTLVTSSSSLSLNSLNSGDLKEGKEGKEARERERFDRHILVENAEQDTAWYLRHFLGNPHDNYVGYDDQKGPYALSVLTSPEDEQDAAGPKATIKAILWRKNVRPNPSNLKKFTLLEAAWRGQRFSSDRRTSSQ
jgi:hypothetical protein